MHASLGQKGLEIIAVPSTEFNQESETDAEVAAFVAKKGVEFTVLSISTINGDECCDLYKYLKGETDKKDITWNFASYFLVDKEGGVARYNAATPLELTDDIEAALGAPDASL